MKRLIIAALLSLPLIASAYPRDILIEGSEVPQSDGFFDRTHCSSEEAVFTSRHHYTAVLDADGWFFMFDPQGQMIGIVGPFWTHATEDSILTIDFAN